MVYSELMTTIRDFNSELISVFGDWHGDLRFAQRAVESVVNEVGSELLFHVGDFGAWRPETVKESGFLGALETLLSSLDRTLIFIDGNHEDHRWLNSLPVNDFGLRQLSPHVIHLPRGGAVRVNDKLIVGLGGARSIDRKRRVEGVSWFPEETITFDDFERARAHGRASLLLTHEAPDAPWLHGGVDHVSKIVSEEQRRYVEDLRRALEPTMLIHGHHHRAYRERKAMTTIVGLDCNKESITKAILRENVINVRMSELS